MASFNTVINDIYDKVLPKHQSRMDANSGVFADIPIEQLPLAIVEGQSANKLLIQPKVLAKLALTSRSARLIRMNVANGLQMRHFAGPQYVRAPGTEFRRLMAKYNGATISVNLRGVEIVVPHETQMDYKEYMQVMEQFMFFFGKEMAGLTDEVITAQGLFNTANFGAAVNSIVPYTQANNTNNTISVIQDLINGCTFLNDNAVGGGYRAIIPFDVFARIRNVQSVQNWVVSQLGPGFRVDQDSFAASFKSLGIDEILFPNSLVNIAAQGATPVYQQVWSPGYIQILKPGNITMSDDQNKEGVGTQTLDGVGGLAYWANYANGEPTLNESARSFPGGNYVTAYPDFKIKSMVIRSEKSETVTIQKPQESYLINTQYS